MINGRIGFLALTQPLTHPPVSKLDKQHTGRLRKRDNLRTGKERGGGARSRIIRPQESLVLYKFFNRYGTLWKNGSKTNVTNQLCTVFVRMYTSTEPV
jgi:hypothetical protein